MTHSMGWVGCDAITVRKTRWWRTALGLLVMVSACGTPSLEELTRSADALAVPADWELLDERSRGPDCPDPVENCPSVDRTYGIPADVHFGDAFQGMFEGAGFDVWDPAATRCGANPEQGCSVSARLEAVSLRATVIETARDSYLVTLRTSEYVGP